MFAIEFNETNLDKVIHETPDLTVEEITQLTNLFLDRNYVFIRGYYNPWVREKWAIMPYFVFNQTFYHDYNKIQTDWDQIVRK